MLQLDYVTNEGQVVAKEIMDESYWIAMRMFRNHVALQKHQLVYLWLCDEEDWRDQVILEKWVR